MTPARHFTHTVTFQETHRDGSVSATVPAVPAFPRNGKWHVRTGRAGTRIVPRPGHRLVEPDGTVWVVRRVQYLVHRSRAICECEQVGSVTSSEGPAGG